MLKTILEDIADNLFNPDPYYQQGGDMVRVGGMTYTLDPLANAGQRVSDMRMGGTLIEANKNYALAGWAPVAEEARNAGHEPMWDVVERYLRRNPSVKPLSAVQPTLKNTATNFGISA
jgi:S-sulfosulfanyl-L-cysteine sulfohydrolase